MQAANVNKHQITLVLERGSELPSLHSAHCLFVLHEW